MKKNTQLAIAETLGMVNQQEGKNRIPAHSKSLMKMLNGRKIGQTPQGEAPTVDIMDSWLKGWDKAKRIDRNS